jgi:cytosine/adenosine deaminase-related metal-dependent hydrolase
MMWRTSTTFVNARVVSDVSSGEMYDSVRFCRSVISLGTRPTRGDTVVDLDGSIVLPGLVNAHDHLELNHYGRIKFREIYRNASEWIDDMRPRLTRDRAIADARRHPLDDRLFAGLLKNLLSGVTTVAHHNPFYRELRRHSPIRVVRRYGWAHSFAMEDRPAGARGELGGRIRERCRATPDGAPFLVHLAEGIDELAARELPELEAIGCLRPTTVLVHGVAVDRTGWRRVAEQSAGLVWCPASNLFLFGRTVDVRQVERVALASDSRLTGARDLLDELSVARRVTTVADRDLVAMVTTRAATLVRQPRAGRIGVDGPADFVVFSSRRSGSGTDLIGTTRSDLRLVMVDGQPLLADPSLASVFDARRSTSCVARVDGKPKLLDRRLARRIATCSIAEAGLALA